MLKLLHFISISSDLELIATYLDGEEAYRAR